MAHKPIENSLRQKVYRYMNIHREFYNNNSIENKEKNQKLYIELPDQNRISIRQYRKQWYEEQKKNKDIENSSCMNNGIQVKIINPLKKNTPQFFHILPLLKTYKLLPLYLMKKAIEHASNLKNTFMISNIFCNLMDSINIGHYKFPEISDFMANIDKSLGSFLSHDSWKISIINNLNTWIKTLFVEIESTHNYMRTGGIQIDRSIKKRNIAKEEVYMELRGKILVYLLPYIYSIFLYERKKELIIQDFGIACWVLNYCDTQSVSLTGIVELYNEDLIFREREEYMIDLGYSEGLEFMNPQEYIRLLDLQPKTINEQLEYKEFLKEKNFVYGDT